MPLDPTRTSFDLLEDAQRAARIMSAKCAVRRQELGPFPSKEAFERHMQRTMTDVACFLAHLDAIAGCRFFEACTPDEGRPQRHSMPSEHQAQIDAVVTPTERAALTALFTPASLPVPAHV